MAKHANDASITERIQQVIQVKQAELHELDSEMSGLQRDRHACKREIGTYQFLLSGTRLGIRELTNKLRAGDMNLDSLDNGNGHTNGKNGKNGKNGNGHRHTGKNFQITPWTDKEDAVIMKIVTSLKEPLPAPQLSRVATKKLKARTEGAVRQRVYRLINEGRLKAKDGTNPAGGMPTKMVEAA